VWRSLVAHTLGVRVVAGSNPATPTKQFPSQGQSLSLQGQRMPV
jgi:hypothetical protein